MELSDDTFSSCISLIENTEFESVEGYLEFIVAEIVEEDDCNIDGLSGAIDESDEDQLDALGYL